MLRSGGCAEPPASFLPPRRPFLPRKHSRQLLRQEWQEIGSRRQEKNPGISTITRKEQHFTYNCTRLHPAILRVEEKVKKSQPRTVSHSRSWQHIRYQLTPLLSELVTSPSVSVIPRNKADRPEGSTPLVKPYTSQGWGPPQRASPGAPREESAGRGSSQVGQLQVPKKGSLWKPWVPFPPLQPHLPPPLL